MTDYAKLPTWADKDHVYAVVETPRGSRAKLEFDPKLGAFTLAKPLLAGLTYPYDWGFVPSTKAQDGDPLDVLIIHDAATYPGLVLKCKPIGVLEVLQSSNGKKERNDRMFVVPDRSPFEGDLQDIRRLPARAIEELEKFFEATDALESKKLQFLGWRGPARARQCERFPLRMKPSDLRVASLVGTMRCTTSTGKFGRRRNENPGAKPRSACSAVAEKALSFANW
jgi:inorganic pyrophosphatase